MRPDFVVVGPQHEGVPALIFGRARQVPAVKVAPMDSLSVSRNHIGSKARERILSHRGSFRGGRLPGNKRLARL